MLPPPNCNSVLESQEGAWHGSNIQTLDPEELRAWWLPSSQFTLCKYLEFAFCTMTHHELLGGRTCCSHPCISGILCARPQQRLLLANATLCVVPSKAQYLLKNTQKPTLTEQPGTRDFIPFDICNKTRR